MNTGQGRHAGLTLSHPSQGYLGWRDQSGSLRFESHGGAQACDTDGAAVYLGCTHQADLSDSHLGTRPLNLLGPLTPLAFASGASMVAFPFTTGLHHGNLYLAPHENEHCFRKAPPSSAIC